MSEAATILPWAPPPVDGPVIGRRRVEDLQALEREAWNNGFAQGQQAGVVAAKNEQRQLHDALAARVQHLDTVLDSLARPLQQLDETVHEQLVTLAAAIARQVIRRELKLQPEQIIAVVRETVALLPVASREVRVHLHPEDAALLRARLSEPGSERAWTLVDDPVLGRGGCRVVSENSTIDARIEQRIGTAVAAIFGDERAVEVPR